MFRAALGVALGMTLLATSGVAAAHPAERSYTVTFENLTTGQPFSPIVAATHQNAIGMFGVGDLASAGLEAIAEDGDNSLMFTAVRYQQARDERRRCRPPADNGRQ